MAYTKRKKNLSGFNDYCQAELSRIKKSRSSGTRAKTALKWQECLCKRGISTGLPASTEKKLKKE